jgi:hypothetical protein
VGVLVLAGEFAIASTNTGAHTLQRGRVQRFKDAIAQRSSPGLVCTRATVKPLTGCACKPTIRHHPPANSMVNGLAASALRRMLLQLSAAAAGAGTGDRALTVKPVTPLSRGATPAQGANRRIRPHPPENFDSCSTG